jgi:small subunit ribosomal protein S4
MSWIRKKKKYSAPRNVFDNTRIEEENGLIQRYGLKNKREIWKANSAIEKIRNQAKNLITAEEEEKEKLFNKLRQIGLDVGSVADALGLDKEDWLKRRLQTLVYKKGLAKTPKEARQLIVHKHISIDGRIVNIPSYIVKIEEESKIKSKIKNGKK